MSTLVEVAPQLVAQLSKALVQKGRTALAAQLEQSKVLRCTFSSDPDVGYVYLVRAASSPLYAKLSTPVAETISFYLECGINVDVDHDGQLFGIEYVGRKDLATTFKAASAL
jgi:hypothetical protein